MPNIDVERLSERRAAPRLPKEAERARIRNGRCDMSAGSDTLPAIGVVATRNERQSDIRVEAKRACEFDGVHACADGPNRNRRNVERDMGLRHDAEASGAS